MAGAKRKMRKMKAGKQGGRKAQRGLNGHGRPGHGQQTMTNEGIHDQALAARFA